MLRNAIWYDSPDGDPVTIILGLVWPKADEDTYLPSLAGLMRRLREPIVRDALRTARSSQAAVAALSTEFASLLPDDTPDPLQIL